MLGKEEIVSPSLDELKEHYHRILTLLGEDPEREGLLKTPERVTLQIKECIQETLNPLGVMVVVEAKHMCMQMRGVEKQNSITTTSDFTGAFNQAKTREEFMNLIRHNS